MPIPLVDLKAQYQTIKTEVDAAIQRVLDDTSFIMGPEVEAFEEEFAAFCGAKHAVGTDSGTAALHLALLVLGTGPGDEVITTTHSFISTAETIALTGARPVFVDIDAHTYNIDPDRIEEAITPRTRAVIPVHIYGQPVEMDAVLDIARRHDLRVIEDAAQAHGAVYRGRPVGTLGDVACFSFYPGKNLGAYGDAGCLVTDDADLAGRARMLRNHGRQDKYEHLVNGYGYRLDGIQAAVLRVKLNHLKDWTDRRRQNARIYNELLSDGGIGLPYEPEHVRAVYHLYVIRVRERDALLTHLNGRGIGAGIHYPIPLHLQPVYRQLGYGRGAFPLAEEATDHMLSLPMYPELTRGQIEEVAASVLEFERGR